MSYRRHIRSFAALTAAAVAILLSVLLIETKASLYGRQGLRLIDETGADRVRVVGGLDLRKGSPGQVSRWAGALHVPTSGSYSFEARTDDAFELAINDQRVLTTRSGQPRNAVSLAAGIHRLEARLESSGGEGHGRIVWGPTGGVLDRMAGDDVFLEPDPGIVERLAVRRRLGVVASVSWLLALIAVTAAMSHGTRVERAERLRQVWQWRRAASGAALALILVLGAWLRFEALVGRYWRSPPPWADSARGLAERHLHDPKYQWALDEATYRGDPVTYRRFAREMRSFYAAHIREPFFVAATKVGLWLMGGRDIGINVTSAFFSALTILGVYLVGTTAFSRGVGLAAAALFSIERDVVGLSVEGWRDDTFACAATFYVWSLLRFRREPPTRAAILAGVLAAVACLTRLSGLLLVVPCLVLLVFSRGPSAGTVRRAALVAAGTLVVLVGPYVINCWRVFGDPFFAVTYHTGFYQYRAGLGSVQPVGLGTFLTNLGDWRELAVRVLHGVTVYPFTNKWFGFDYIAPSLGMWLPRLSVVGLVLMLFSPSGRLLLLALLGALIPYAFTYNILGGHEWRFTLVAYPFYLIAAALPVFLSATGSTVIFAALERRAASRQPSRK